MSGRRRDARRAGRSRDLVSLLGSWWGELGRPGEETLILPGDTRSGHSSLTVTTDVYGHWERAEHKREAALMEGIFGV